MVRRAFALLGILGGTALAAALLTGSPDAAPRSVQAGSPASGGRAEWVRQLADVLTAIQSSDPL